MFEPTPTVTLDAEGLFDDALLMTDDVEQVKSLMHLVPAVAQSPFSTLVLTSEHLKGSELVLGRHLDHFKDARLSTKHCLLYHVPEEQTEVNDLSGVYVVDVSTNGTFINGKRLVKNEPTKLLMGAQLSLVVPTSKHSLASELPVFDVREVPVVESSPSTLASNETQVNLNTTSSMIDDVDHTESHENNKRKREASPTGMTSDETDPSSSSSGEPMETTVIESPAKIARTEETASVAASSSDNQAVVETKKPKYDEATARILAMFGDVEESQEDSQGELRKELTCGICSELFYKPVSLLPCLHNFCGSCFSQWMDQNHTCPQCRVSVTQVKKNHAIANLTESLLRMKPHLRRSVEEQAELDKINKITTDTFVLSENNSDNEVEDDEDDEDEEEEEEEEDYPSSLEDDDPVVNRYACRECTTAGLDGHQCTPVQVHVSCTACRRIMPCRTNLPEDRTQQCSLCLNYFCLLYYGSCDQPSLGMLKRFDEFEDITTIPLGCLNNNPFERQILVNYMTGKQWTPQDIFDQCCEKLRTGEISFTSPNKTASTMCCRNCAQIMFSELLYAYRASIPNNELPGSVTSRSNCWYGKECRTQQHNPDHARRLNHICDNARRR